jgi:copper resistance protein B
MTKWPVLLALTLTLAGGVGAEAQPRSADPPAEKANTEPDHHHHHEAGHPPDKVEEDSPEIDEPSPSHQHHAHGEEPEPPPSHSSHSEMDHSEHMQGEIVGHPGTDPHTPERTPATAPIDPYFTTPEMDRARAEARREMGGGRFLMLQGDRLEWRSGEGSPVGLFEGQGWYGGDMNRLWVKADAEVLFDADSAEEELESVEVQALFSRPISPFFDLQVGLRHDLEPGPSRTLAVVGLQGLAPHWFEVGVALFLSEDGDLSSRLEAEYDLLFTQELMLQVRSELEVEGSDVPELGLRSGPSHVEAGVRLSYGRVFAPYIGVSWEEKLGKTADLARAAGEEIGSVSAVAGIRFWY